MSCMSVDQAPPDLGDDRRAVSARRVEVLPALAVVFRAGDFFAALFFGVVFFATIFLMVVVFVATFLAAVFLAAVFLAGVLGDAACVDVVLSPVAFCGGDFLAAAFFTGVLVICDELLAGAFTGVVAERFAAPSLISFSPHSSSRR